MSYFDHASCPECNTSFNPERIQVIQGRASCPTCGAELGITDYFGLAAAFDEETEPQPTLDDLVPGFGSGSRPRQQPSAKSEQATPTRSENSEDVLKRLRSLKK